MPTYQQETITGVVVCSEPARRLRAQSAHQRLCNLVRLRHGNEMCANIYPVLATYHTALLETNPAVDYSLEQLKDDFKLQLFTSVAMLITDENSPDKLAEMEDMLEEGQRKPNVEASGAKQNSRTYEAWFRRLVEYHKDQSSWDDYFSGRPIPTAFAGRETEEVEARKAALQAKKNAKLEALRKTRLKKRREQEAKADGVMPPGYVGPTQPLASEAMT